MSLAAITSKFIGKPYLLGGMDCFSSIMLYLHERGVAMPDEYHGVRREDYPALFLADPETAKALMVRLMDDMLSRVDPPFAFAGDILLLRLPTSEKPPFLAIDGGNGNIIAAAESRGVVQLPMKHYVIERAWRCRQRFL
ncbi:MAG: hypothetical protein WCZ86_05870 [Desulfurivibrionaceae bacterium]|jgi:hypothetical protein